MLKFIEKTTKKAYQSVLQNGQPSLNTEFVQKTYYNYCAEALYANEQIIKFNQKAARTDGGPVDCSHWKVERNGIVAANLTKKPIKGIKEIAVVNDKNLINGKPGTQYVTGTFTHIDVSTDSSTYDRHPKSDTIVNDFPIIAKVFDESKANSDKKQTKIVNKQTHPVNENQPIKKDNQHKKENIAKKPQKSNDELA